ncbi:hypothetical protein O181_002200 [Austropuccinia psidii MF-1]|uniref:Protein CPL1-like domain-containing protein n=1 Tax=Austropuccinia psidii MF-1 TaxID=1389203 RepID=A0A9Q3BBZ7_9BASI|nr:hypothetical protein [Austropuccinia psidii MF-1]
MNRKVLYIFLAAGLSAFPSIAANHHAPQETDDGSSHGGLAESSDGPDTPRTSNHQEPSWLDEGLSQEQNPTVGDPTWLSDAVPQSDAAAPSYTLHGSPQQEKTDDRPKDCKKKSQNPKPQPPPDPYLENDSTSSQDDQAHYGIKTIENGQAKYTPIYPNTPPTNAATPTKPCPGPLNPTTGAGALDDNGQCIIVCYNNLILNASGNDCICPPTFELDESKAKCVCRSPYVQRGCKCVLQPSQAPSANRSGHKKRSLIPQIPLMKKKAPEKFQRSKIDEQNCPSGEIACPMSTAGGLECLDPMVTLTSCGGCSSTGKGVDCTTIQGADEVGCNEGRCHIITCKWGYKLVDGTCAKKKRKLK